MVVSFEIPDEVLEAASVEVVDWEHEARKELALAFYSRGILSLGKAAELSGGTRMEFERWLGERGTVRPFSPSDLAVDLEVFSDS